MVLGAVMSKGKKDNLCNIADYQNRKPDESEELLFRNPFGNLTPLEHELWAIVQYISELLRPEIPGNGKAFELTQRAIGLLEVKAQGDSGQAG